MSSTPQPLDDHEPPNDFVRRHNGSDQEEINEMLERLNVESIDDLIEQTIPEAIRADTPLNLPRSISEPELLARVASLATGNKVHRSMIGMGYYDTFLPPVIQRNVLENPGWYTAYTPYQPEVSQGRLEVLLAFQQMVADLTGFPIANASLLDEGTAAAEAMAMARRVSKKNPSNVFLVSEDCHPQTIGVLKTRATPMGIEVIVGELEDKLAEQSCFGVLAQYPGSCGHLPNLEPVAHSAHQKEALLIVATDLLALTLITPPGEFGADIAIGSAQRFGVPMGYGGPHAAFLATRDEMKRNMPGRLIGVSKDVKGRQALRMALQTREQHIRRDKATSNICTAQVLLAVLAALFAIYHGPRGLTAIAARVHRLTTQLATALRQLGIEIKFSHFFDTLTVVVPGRAEALTLEAERAGINLRLIDGDHLGLSVDETTTADQLDTLLGLFAENAGFNPDANSSSAIPAGVRRSTPFLQHPLFNRFHSETEMLRYLRRLAAKDITLDRAMIPLGSCTMKLNAASEMVAMTHPHFAALHPFAPKQQAEGYHQLFSELEHDLCEITGFDAVSLQPNAGSQGEYAGLLCIHRYLALKGEGERNICLIPASAHGTNPASAIMAGMRVVVVKCDDRGNVDMDDLETKSSAHAENLAALMITYPSTHGVFEETIIEICQIIHRNGGQVYMDGANLNAMVGLCRPGLLGPDVMHINLHKTFAIPHGGGGPGMGPIGVRAHLAPFLPDHPVIRGVNPAAQGESPIGNISAAPWGSSSILPISWSYIRLMGGKGLKKATEAAILNANYMAHCLSPYYPILYTGSNNRVAHECIIDIRPLKAATGITAEDIAKRLIDFGFHAPTMSFPVAETLMIEPTESESKSELDRFCKAMIAIHGEITEIEEGRADPEDNVLKHAPHTAELLMDEDWNYPYSRRQAFYPLDSIREDKYWPPVSRVDNVHGDRHLVCSYPPIEACE
ncbi:MAG TPA: aminomethyl-transferring glycine dehydrogenase [Arenicellales bacterium]|jgi:glycine dehydrogenase|nr:aminomethyl-transferring glycine dehydrogenase [Arenicellales bacterium]